jgi:hypothetical protein
MHKIKEEDSLMKERVGECLLCKKELFCLDGFFQGQVKDTGETYCFLCFEELKKESDKKPNS